MSDQSENTPLIRTVSYTWEELRLANLLHLWPSDNQTLLRDVIDREPGFAEAIEIMAKRRREKAEREKAEGW